MGFVEGPRHVQYRLGLLSPEGLNLHEQGSPLPFKIFVMGNPGSNNIPRVSLSHLESSRIVATTTVPK